VASNWGFIFYTLIYIYIFIRHEGSTTNRNTKHITNHYNNLRKGKKERKKRKIIIIK